MEVENGHSGGPAGDAVEEGREFYESKLAQLTEERAKLLDGTHQALVEGAKELAITRDRLLKDAALNRELRIREIEALYDFDVKAAKAIFNNEVAEMKDKLLVEIGDSIKRLEEMRDGSNDAEVRSSSRKLRSKRTDNDEEMRDADAPDDTANPNAGGAEAARAETFAGAGTDELSGLKFFMHESAVCDDLRQIQRDWKQRAEKFLSAAAIAEQSVRVADGVLYLNEMILEKDADVVCTTEVTREEVHGSILSLSPSEVIVKLVDGTQTRLLITHLRSGRCTIAPFEEE